MAGKLSKLSIILFFLSACLYLVLLPFIHYPLNTIIKPIPIILLIIIAWQTTADQTTKTFLIIALILSLLGDIVLTLPGELAFKLGILSFLLAHSAYISLFLKDAQFRLNRTLYFLPILLFILGSYWFMSPHLEQMLIPVTIYLCFLAIMVFTAFQVQQHPVLIIGGACSFLFSDFIFALTQFVLGESHYTNILIMFSYYLAQLLLVLGLIQRQTGLKPA
ncbi:lysoplasmalogenase [Legionella hackeliae]|uniref:Putative membrane protein n=1 Tax=Legionella hackeliae TaxID=449 RepID=A0A0A8UKB3_LEGHA|nr:lysoplasmalogenase [Legionella hackeliae]KTD13472.1 transmembrane protein [Legionella hackeliae]CEK09315.1 putative membrane protein [Legionella hackeliae]STX49220.1 transmembrane protein [Legionella hackeliae]